MEATSLQTSTDWRRLGIEAQDAYEETQKVLSGLIFQLKAIGKRHSRIAMLIAATEVDPKEPLQSESPLLMLSASEFEGIGHEAIRTLTNAIVLARKEVTEARSAARSLGRNV